MYLLNKSKHKLYKKVLLQNLNTLLELFTT